MKKYKTNKEVTVEEMSRLEYVLSRGWTLPDNEQHLKDERVFKVYYKDGYISMCPKDKFLEDAVEIKDSHIGRMRLELKELYDKYIKLSTFLNQEYQESKFTDETQRGLLNTQANIMYSYITVLETRIKYDCKKSEK